MMVEILRHCPPDCRDDGICHPDQPLPYNKNVCYRPPKDIVKTDDPSTCPRCGSTDVAWCGGDSDGSNYYHMYLCEDCGRLPGGIRVFLVPCSEEDYGHDPLALPGDPDAVTSMAFKEIDFGFEEEA